jgi:hypothetical protein
MVKVDLMDLMVKVDPMDLMDKVDLMIKNKEEWWTLVTSKKATVSD